MSKCIHNKVCYTVQTSLVRCNKLNCCEHYKTSQIDWDAFNEVFLKECTISANGEPAKIYENKTILILVITNLKT